MSGLLYQAGGFMEGCSNHYCYLTGPRKGMSTNSTCNCLRDLPLAKRVLVERRIQTLENILTRLIDITEKHHVSPNDIIIAGKYNAIKTAAMEFLGI